MYLFGILQQREQHLKIISINQENAGTKLYLYTFVAVIMLLIKGAICHRQEILSITKWPLI